MFENLIWERKKLKILLIGIVAIAVGLSLFYLKPSKTKTGGFLTSEAKIQLASFELSKTEIHEGGITELRILIRNNDEIPHHVSVRLNHNPRIKIKTPDHVTNNLTILGFPKLSPGMGIEYTLELTGSLPDLVYSIEYVLEVTLLPDTGELISKDLKLKVIG